MQIRIRFGTLNLPNKYFHDQNYNLYKFSLEVEVEMEMEMEDEIFGLNISAIYLTAVKTVTQQNRNITVQPEEVSIFI